MATGLGPDGHGQRLDTEKVRRAVGAAVRALDSIHPQHIHIAVGDDATSAAAVQGALLGAYTYTEYRSGSTGRNCAASRSPFRTQKTR